MAGKIISEKNHTRALLCASEAVFGITVSTAGFTTSTDEIVPDPLYSTEQAATFRKYFQEHISIAEDLIGFGESVPCSLETPTFIEEHHAALFRGFTPAVRDACVSLYNAIGKRQRADLETQGFGRRWTLWHIMRRSRVELIANGGCDYAHVRPAVRRQCLIDLLAKVSEPRWRIKLVITDSLPESVLHYFHGFDAVACIGHSFTFRRDSTRAILCSTAPRRVEQYRSALHEVVAHAGWRTPEQSSGFLEELIRHVS